MHVHLVFVTKFPPKVAVTKIVNSLKGVSSRRLRQEFPDLVRHYWRANKLSSGSYFAGTVGGAPLSVVPAGVSITRLRQDRPSRRSSPRVVNTGRPAPPNRNPRRSASTRQLPESRSSPTSMPGASLGTVRWTPLRPLGLPRARTRRRQGSREPHHRMNVS